MFTFCVLPATAANATAAAGRSSDESPYPDWRYAIRINGSFAPTTDAEPAPAPSLSPHVANGELVDGQPVILEAKVADDP